MRVSKESLEWDAHAATFDAEPDHGLLDPEVRAAWTNLILPLLPPAPASVLDVGCGTGSLAVLLGHAGYDVHGIDFSERMVAAAREKARVAGVEARFEVGDAQAPAVGAASYDVVLGRHILWALPDPSEAVRSWVALLKQPGVLVLIEGRWSTGAGLTAAECERLVRPHREELSTTRLGDPALWGRAITDERYLLVSRR
jgi:SAM-dependent methyltransferase